MFTLKYLENFVVIAVLIMLKIGVSLASPTTLPPDLTTMPTETTAVPSVTTALSNITTALPNITTALPNITTMSTETTTVPAITTTMPNVTTAIPVVTTTAIPTTTKIPVITNVTTTIPVVTTTAIPVITTKTPEITTTTTIAPVVQTQKNESSSIEDKFSEIPLPSSASSSSLLERVNIDQYLRNKRAMNLQIKCVVYGGTCDLVGKEVKKYIIIGLTGKCTNCSQRMTASVEKVVSYIQENYPQAWNDAIYKYLVEPVFSDKYRSPNATTPKPDDTAA